nr:MAG TPA: Swa2p, ubiquitin, Swa2, auxilin, ubiquitin-associated [Caudoviricetes sp.]
MSVRIQLSIMVIGEYRTLVNEVKDMEKNNAI